MKDTRNYAQLERDKELMQEYGRRTTSLESNNSGGKTKVTRYDDGSSTVHHGGPVGDVSYNKFGEEC